VWAPSRTGRPPPEDGRGRSGGSYFSQSDLRLHFGLGPHEKANLEIAWPSGLVEKIEGVRANQILRVVEGKSAQEG
jgi:enediyne biosynthesis protein E4